MLAGTPTMLAFARQLGPGSIQLNTPDLPGEHRWEAADLIDLRLRCEAAGLRLEAIENIPSAFYERAMLGLPGRDEEIEHVRATLRNIGRAGIPILGYDFMPLSVWRTSVATPGRGGAIMTAFDLDVALDPARAGEVWVARRDKRRDDPFVAAAHIDLGVALRRVGFDGFLLDDHVTRMIDDSDYMHRGRAHAMGYLQGLLPAVLAERSPA